MMREADVSGCELVCAGRPWTQAQEPCTRDMLRLLERNENYCYWFQPHGKGVEAQFPAIAMRGRFFHLSLRVQKAVFRHVRLDGRFRNVERVPDGRCKLRIPHHLLLEKRRTSSRFTVPLPLLWPALAVCVRRARRQRAVPPAFS
jgi:hypothetical protein